MFDNFIKDALAESLAVIGEPVSIGGNQFKAAFDEIEMSVDRNVYGDADEMTARATCASADLTDKPKIGEVLTRINTSKRYVILDVQEDVGSYEISLRAKNG